MIIFLWFCFLVLGAVTTTSDESNNGNCFKVRDYYWKHLATKTPYRYVANNNDTKISYDGCVPKKIWAVLRHGTRYPSVKIINKMRTRLVEIRNAVSENVEQKKGSLCLPHLNNITLWTPQIDLEDQKGLAHEGEDEMVLLAERFQNRFPNLLDVDYSNSTFRFQYTEKERTKKSKYHFTVGLFGRRIAHHVWSSEASIINRFYKHCPKWGKEVEKNPKTTIECRKFIESDIAKEVVKNIALRLGFDKGLSFEDVDLMYVACSYESAWNRFAPSPWCSLFTEEEISAMEFFYDLKHYWKSGYGHDINFQQACPMLEDMLQHFQSEDGRTSAFHFTHSGTLLKLIAHLGLFYDEFKLTHDKLTRPRLWRVSYMDAFATNLALVTFQCGDQLKVLTLHQERPVKLPGCPKEGLCSWDKIKKTFKRSFNDCQFEEICKV